MCRMEATQSEAPEPKDICVGSGNRVTSWSPARVRTQAASACRFVQDRFITSFSTSGWASGSLVLIWRLSATNKGRRNSRSASRRSVTFNLTSDGLDAADQRQPGHRHLIQLYRL